MPSIYSRESRPGLSYSRTSDQRSEYVCPCGRWWYSFFEGFNPPDQRCHDCRQMVNSVESETKNRYELMARILPDDDDVSTATTRVVPIEESRRIDQIMKGSDAGILVGLTGLHHFDTPLKRSKMKLGCQVSSESFNEDSIVEESHDTFMFIL